MKRENKSTVIALLIFAVVSVSLLGVIYNNTTTSKKGSIEYSHHNRYVASRAILFSEQSWGGEMRDMRRSNDDGVRTEIYSQAQRQTANRCNQINRQENRRSLSSVSVTTTYHMRTGESAMSGADMLAYQTPMAGMEPFGVIDAAETRVLVDKPGSPGNLTVPLGSGLCMLLLLVPYFIFKMRK